ncbi:hypothetical protein EOD39_18092 [Acipenser ruthenus]|uniref:Uncharacterized protein n=1 Tax=Acipenser ruthenus TaxID=7906 RepID=A0A444V1N1_ACIRT|nr:hypothetical protein EOD39_18092 [Acipenser ruthenus]
MESVNRESGTVYHTHTTTSVNLNRICEIHISGGSDAVQADPGFEIGMRVHILCAHQSQAIGTSTVVRCKPPVPLDWFPYITRTKRTGRERAQGNTLEPDQDRKREDTGEHTGRRTRERERTRGSTLEHGPGRDREHGGAHWNMDQDRKRENMGEHTGTWTRKRERTRGSTLEHGPGQKEREHGGAHWNMDQDRKRENMGEHTGTWTRTGRERTWENTLEHGPGQEEREHLAI